MNDTKQMTKEDAIKKIKKILAKDERFKDVKIELLFKDKKRPSFI